MDGALMEIGPYRVKDDHTLIYNNGSWDEFANLLFVDQPVGTGFSYVNTNSFLHDLDHVAAHMITFLEKWFAMFPEYESDDVSTLPSRPLTSLIKLFSCTLRESHMQGNTSHTLPGPSSSEIKTFSRNNSIGPSRVF